MKRFLVFVVMLVALPLAAQYPADLAGDRVPDGVYQTEMYLGQVLDAYPWGSAYETAVGSQYWFGVADVAGDRVDLRILAISARMCSPLPYGVPEGYDQERCCHGVERPNEWHVVRMLWDDDAGCYLAATIGADGLRVNALSWKAGDGAGIFTRGLLVPAGGTGWTWSDGWTFEKFPIKQRVVGVCATRRPSGVVR